MVTLNNRNLCENCFSEVTNEPCPHCGFTKSKYRHDPVTLVVGSVLNQRYMIGGVVGKGGFGITYLAYDLKLDARVAVKEYYPMGLAIRNPGSKVVTVSNEESGESFRTGAEKFYNEAKMVAKFNGNPNIVSVHDFFYENETVYFIMGYLQGQTLKSYLKKKKITEGQAVSIFNQISNALYASHSMNILHRDVSPDNIMLCDDGTIRLLDFGAARQVMAEQSQSLSVILKQGYAPLEQYQKKGKQGPWTDIYALGATIYTALTGDMLNDPMSRLEDDSDYGANKYGISDTLWDIIHKSTQIKISDRYQDIAELKGDLSRVGIEPEKFDDIEEEITDFLRGKKPKGNTLDAAGKQDRAPTEDPYATMLLSAAREKQPYETVAVSPESSAPRVDVPQYAQPMQQDINRQPMPGALNAQPMQQDINRQPMPQPGASQSMPGALNAQPLQQDINRQPMPQPGASQSMPGAYNAQPQGGGLPTAMPSEGTPRKKKLSPILLIGLLIAGIAATGIVIYSEKDNDRIEAEWDQFEEYFGIDYLKLEDINEKKAEKKDMPQGVLVKEIDAGGAADSTGIKENDIITGFDGAVITKRYDLKKQVLSHDIGDTSDIVIERQIDGTYQKMEGTITLGSAGSSSDANESDPDNDVPEEETSDDTAADANENAPYLGIRGISVEAGSDMPEGVYVDKVYSGSGADEAGIREGYIIVQFDGQNIETEEELTEIVQSHKAGDSVLVVMKVKPDGSSSYGSSFRTYVTLGSE